MTKTQYERKIIELVRQDQQRVKALSAVYQLDLPDCYIAAGFVRNLVWDYLHQKACSTPLNDIDVIYYDPTEKNSNMYAVYEEQLKALEPEFNWQVRNQSLMHRRNNDAPYQSTLDAMSYWVEKETAVAIRKTSENQYECISSFGFESLFNLKLTHNPKRTLQTFNERVHSKQWLEIWPKLTVIC
ncbi:nucleotidyltransferase family protein [Vibrio hannami]|uniref:nucleotidyltransferase family protein n=1 Tax=Vibrio hannami TaxID=2717094 RepID=UPI00240FD070|nr:nucleotidyltransferase family protein [Vibrio hannami]MDG3087758.1 nucleotidyltransferase family protein [Vibrio hannami]